MGEVHFRGLGTWRTFIESIVGPWIDIWEQASSVQSLKWNSSPCSGGGNKVRIIARIPTQANSSLVVLEAEKIKPQADFYLDRS